MDTCIIIGCPRAQEHPDQYCGIHHAEFEGDEPVVVEQKRPRWVSKKTCTLEGCDKPQAGRGFCRLHYIRLYRHGTTEPVGRRPGYDPICSVEGCDSPSSTRGFCAKHYTRVHRHGDPTVVFAEQSRKAIISYRGALHRVLRERGQPGVYPCAECGKFAQCWSYDGGDPDEQRGPAQKIADREYFYSLDPQRYSPRCWSCRQLNHNGRRPAPPAAD